MSQPSSSESSPEHNLTDMGEFVEQGFADGTGLFIFDCFRFTSVAVAK